MFITISELEETSALKNDDVFAISTMNGSTESTKKVKYSSIMGGVTSIVNQTEKKLNGLSFGTDSSGNWGYIKPGADSVTPFRNAAEIEEAYMRGKEEGAEQASTGDQYGLGYALGYDKGQASVKVAHKLTVPAAKNANASITANWYTTVDNTACYEAGVASVKQAHTLTVPTTKGKNVAITANWYTAVNNEACYNAGMAAADNRAEKTSTNYKTGYNTGYVDGKYSVFAGIAASSGRPDSATLSSTALMPAGYYRFYYLRMSTVSPAYMPSASVSISGSYTQGSTGGIVNQDWLQQGYTSYTLNDDCTVTVSCGGINNTDMGQSMCAFVKTGHF